MEEDLNLEEILRELEMPMGDEGADHLGTEEPAMEEGAEMGHDEEENIDEIIEAILRETEEMEEPASDVSALEEENTELKDELEEAYNTVKQLKSVINEVNLLNAKLLYTNKLFRNFDLNESQKMKVIENFDRAANTREAKLVFATLAESFNKPKLTPKRKMVKESIASKPVATTAPSKETTQILSEGFEMANRWKKLAGLI
jgi:predicted RNase H-like nuclease (RuvC/YqgF family)